MNYTSNTKGRLSVLGQICKLIPPHLVPKTLRRLAETQGVKIQARSFSVWSHIVSLLFCHVGHCLSINDICDSLGLHAGLLNSIRNATAPRRNTLSHANKTRSSEVIKAVYSDILAHCRDMHPAFCARGHRCYFRFPRKLKRVVRAIDSTTIELNIISDDEVELHADKSRRLYPGRLRLIRARVRATDGTEKEMTFLTNNFEWAASTICDLYRCRWSIEVFFKEIKQCAPLSVSAAMPSSGSSGPP